MVNEKNDKIKYGKTYKYFSNGSFCSLYNHGQHALLSFLNSLPISVLRNLELEANNLYDRASKLYKAALKVLCQTFP